jgi:hypothetical protein
VLAGVFLIWLSVCMGSHLNVNSVFVIAPTRYLLGVILRDVGFLKGEAGFDVFVGRRTMTELRCRFSDDMTLHGLAPSTQKVYLNAFEQLAAHYHRSPDQLTEQELRDYFTYLVKKRRIAQSTLKTYIFAIKLLYTKTLQKPWPTLKLLRPRTEGNCRSYSIRTRPNGCWPSNALPWLGCAPP